ncbi:MAG TPA: AMP-binding protein, partial [Longimicrobiales bacterium]|nr:AMP-binding protein [Longimicrobiales bacterium]
MISDPGIYERAAADREAFWADWARELDWFRPWDTVLDWSPPHARWFVGGTLNVSHNCLDRHASSARRDKTALLWEGEPGDARRFTYAQLHREVCRFANVLKGLGVVRGDRVTIYLPMIPEAAVAMLACARIGAIHSVVFGGFSPESLADRNNDARAKVLVTADGGWRRGGVIPLKANADEALASSPTVESVVVVRRGGTLSDSTPVAMKEGRDHWYHDLMGGASDACEPEHMDAEDTLYILYTSGTTGKPKGVMLTHNNIASNVRASRMALEVSEADNTVSFLPLSHILQRMCDYLFMWVGCRIAYPRSIDTLVADLKVIRPTVVVSVPRIYEKIYNGIMAAHGVKKLLVRWAADVADRVA